MKPAEHGAADRVHEPMQICVATVGDRAHNCVQRDEFLALAAKDEVGRHGVVDDPEAADVIVFVDLHQHPDDPFLRALRRHPLAAEAAERVFVYDERDLPFVTFPGIYVSGTPSLARRHPGAVVGGPYPRLPNRVEPTLEAPDLLFSFQGARTHPVREAVLNLRHARAVVEDTSSTDAVAGAGDSVELVRSRYQEVVKASKFVICPRGHGASSFRLYETLHAGRVPVVVSDDWLPPPGIDWSNCVVRVREADALEIPRMLERLEPTWDVLVAQGAQVMRDHLAPTKLWHHYASSIALLAGRRRRRHHWWAEPEVARIAFRRTRSALGWLPRR